MSHIKIAADTVYMARLKFRAPKMLLPIIAASVLNNGDSSSSPLPTDNGCASYARILQQSGARIMWDDGDVWIKTDQMDTVAVSSLDAGKMRSSIILLGALLGRGQEVTMPYPGSAVP